MNRRVTLYGVINQQTDHMFEIFLFYLMVEREGSLLRFFVTYLACDRVVLLLELLAHKFTWCCTKKGLEG